MALSLPRARVQSLVGELRSHKPCKSVAKKKKKKRITGDEWELHLKELIRYVEENGSQASHCWRGRYKSGK